MISLDRKILSTNSQAAQRMVKYSQKVDFLDIIIFSKKGFPQSVILLDKIKIWPTNSLNKFFYIFDAIKIGKKILNKNYSLSYLITAQDPYETGLAAWCLARRFALDLQLQVHTDIFSPYFWQESWLNKIRVLIASFLLKRAKEVRVVSKRIKDSLIKKLKIAEENISLAPILIENSITKEGGFFDLHKKYQQFDFIILMASRLTKEKNISLALRSFQKIVQKKPKTGLLIVGEGPLKQSLLALTKKISLNSNVVFEDWTDDLISYYKSADLFLLTSNYEGCGRTILEAAAVGCPILTTNVGCAGEKIMNNEKKLVIPVNDQSALVMALEKFVSQRSFI